MMRNESFRTTSFLKLLLPCALILFLDACQQPNAPGEGGSSVLYVQKPDAGEILLDGQPLQWDSNGRYTEESEGRISHVVSYQPDPGSSLYFKHWQEEVSDGYHEYTTIYETSFEAVVYKGDIEITAVLESDL